MGDGAAMLSFADFLPRGHPVIDALMEDPRAAEFPEGSPAAVIGLEAGDDGSWQASLDAFATEAETGIGIGKTSIVAVAILPDPDDGSSVAAETLIALTVRTLAQTLAPDTRVNAVTFRGIPAAKLADAAGKALTYLSAAPAVTGQVVQLSDPAVQGAALEAGAR
jgi:hypothetical protein